VRRISTTLKEADYKLKRSLMTIKLRLKVDPEIHVPDLLTRVRILASVSVVLQTLKQTKFPDGNEYLDISIKFMPNSQSSYKNLITMSKMVKSMPGIKSVRVIEMAGKPVTFQGNPIVV
jgi:hypothetical protein